MNKTLKVDWLNIVVYSIIALSLVMFWGSAYALLAAWAGGYSVGYSVGAWLLS
jgi:uncharacterized protein YebE (UPF0316 family)